MLLPDEYAASLQGLHGIINHYLFHGIQSS